MDKNKTYFVCSDIHSFFDEWILALKENGFEVDNPNHILIICGDIFDRGTKPLDVYNFIIKLPKERRILIRGNHEILLQELVIRGYELSHDIHNGTFDTLCYIAKEPTRYEFLNKLLYEKRVPYGEPGYEEYRSKREKKMSKRNHKLFNNRKLKEILKWINSDEWVDYYETEHFIFVHSFIPICEKMLDMDGFKFPAGERAYWPEWREASHLDWEEAMWGSPWEQYKMGLFKPEEEKGKTLVCGHWHTSDFWNNLTYANNREKWVSAEHSVLFKDPNYNLIGLDGCTALSHKVNVLVLKESEL